MADRTTPRFRLVTARRVATLTGAVALSAAGALAATQAHAEGEASDKTGAVATQAEGEATHRSAAEAEGEGASHAAEAQGEGEAEGARQEDEAVELLTGLAFMEGHIRAGLALYEQGDLAAAKTHMGHPIEEKYKAVEAQLDRSGHGVLEEQIRALAAATEAEADPAKVRALFDNVRETMEAVRADYPAEKQVAGLIALTRIAGNEYAAAVGDGKTVSDLHEYQDSWGFLQVVKTEAEQMAGSDDKTLAAVAHTLVEQAETTDAVYGDLQGKGSYDADPAVIYGAAARMELAASKLKGASPKSEGEGESN